MEVRFFQFPGVRDTARAVPMSYREHWHRRIPAEEVVRQGNFSGRKGEQRMDYAADLCARDPHCPKESSGELYKDHAGIRLSPHWNYSLSAEPLPPLIGSAGESTLYLLVRACPLASRGPGEFFANAVTSFSFLAAR